MCANVSEREARLQHGGSDNRKEVTVCVCGRKAINYAVGASCVGHGRVAAFIVKPGHTQIKFQQRIEDEKRGCTRVGAFGLWLLAIYCNL